MAKGKRELVLRQSHDQLEKFLESKVAALPKNFNQTRFLQNCMTVLQDTKDIEKMHPVSVARTMLKGAFLGLDFFNGECYAIPYGNELNFQTDYKGEVKLAKKYSVDPISDIYAKVVREGDFFEEEIINGKQSVTFRPIPFNDGEIIGAFAVVIYADGTLDMESMTKKEIEQIRQDFSKAKNSPAWTKTPGEMYKKTVLRRLTKRVSLDFDTPEQLKAYKDGADVEFEDEGTKAPETSPFDEYIDVEEIEEAEFTEVEQAPPEGTRDNPEQENFPWEN